MENHVPYTKDDLKAYADHLVADYYKQFSLEYDIKFEIGNKYIKVIHVGSSEAVHSFIDKKTGDIWKAATWKAPAKNFTRGNIQKRDFSRCLWTGCI